MLHVALLFVLQDFDAEYAKLEKDYKSAVDEYYKPLREAKTDEERKKVKLDPAKRPDATFVPKFQDLADRAKGTDAGLSSLLWIVRNGKSQADVLTGAVDGLLASYLESPKLEAFAAELQYARWQVGDKKAEEALRTMTDKSPHAGVKAAAMLSLAAMFTDNVKATAEQKAEAKRLFETIQKDYADTKSAKRAKGYLFELEHLQIGMTAPDFEGKTIDDQPIKLSDFRGKVVVIDFWGFW